MLLCIILHIYYGALTGKKGYEKKIKWVCSGYRHGRRELPAAASEPLGLGRVTWRLRRTRRGKNYSGCGGGLGNEGRYPAPRESSSRMRSGDGRRANAVRDVLGGRDGEKAIWRSKRNMPPGARRVSNNSAHRATPDVPVMVPEINAGHGYHRCAAEKTRWEQACVVKPNCSLRSYIIPLMLDKGGIRH